MSKKKDRFVVGLDIGTHKVCAIVAQTTDEGRLDVIGIGQAESKGVRKGVVINLEATIDSVKRVVEEAELMAGVEIGSAYVGLAGTTEPARRERAQRAGALLQDLGDLAREVSELHVEASGDLRLVLRGAGEVVRMGPPPWHPRFRTFLGLRKELAARCPEAEYFDLRYRDRIYVMQPPEPVPPAAPAPAAVGPDPSTRETALPAVLVR